MANDLDQLNQFMGVNQSTQPAQAPSDLDQLNQFMSPEMEQEKNSFLNKTKENLSDLGATIQENMPKDIGSAAAQIGKTVVGAVTGVPVPGSIGEAEALSGGFTGGITRELEAKTGLAVDKVNKMLGTNIPGSEFLGEEAQKKRKEETPGTAAAEVAGNIGLGTLGAPLLAPLRAAGWLGAGAAGAIEGGVLSAAQNLDDKALGDPEVNAQKIASDIGINSILGGTLGLLVHGLTGGMRKNGVVKGTVSDAIEKMQDEPSAVASIPAEAPPVEINPESPHRAEYESAIKKTDLASMEAALAKAKASGMTTELPNKSAVVDAESRLGDLQLPLNRLQVDSLDSQGARDQLGILKQLRMEGGGSLAEWEAAQKAERLIKTDEAIKSIAPGAELTGDLGEAGQKAVKFFTDNNEAFEKQYGPLMDSIKSYETALPMEHENGVIDSMVKRVPGVSRMFGISEDGERIIKPYSTSWGIDKSTYNAVEQAFKALQEPTPLNIHELMNIRQGLEQNVNIFERGKAAGQVRALKAGMMDYIQGELERVEPNLPAQFNPVRDLFKKWAIHEQQKDIIENAFGASVGSPEFNQMSRVNPEKILGKIFSDSSHVAAAKAILPRPQFNELLAEFLASGRNSVTKDRVFSSNNFYRFLNKNKYALSEAVGSDHAKSMQRINDLNLTMRNFADAGPTNTSKTGNAIAEIFKKGASGEVNLGTILGNAKEMVGDKLTEAANRRVLDKALGATSNKMQKISAAKKITDSVDEKMLEGIKRIGLSTYQSKRGEK